MEKIINTEKEIELIEQFKNQIKPLLIDDEDFQFCNDQCLRRYLRAREFDLKKSEIMLK